MVTLYRPTSADGGERKHETDVAPEWWSDVMQAAPRMELADSAARSVSMCIAIGGRAGHNVEEGRADPDAGVGEDVKKRWVLEIGILPRLTAIPGGGERK